MCKPCTVVVAPEHPATRRVWLVLVVFTVAVLMTTKGPLYRIRIAFADLPVGRDFIDDRWIQGAFLVVYAVLIAICWPAHTHLWRRAKPIVVSQAALVAVIIVSAIWSIATRRTLEQGVMMAAGTAGFALAAATLSPRQVLASIWVAVQIGVLASLIAGWADWRYAFDRNDDLTGIYLNRNSLGAVAAIGILTSVALVAVLASRPAASDTDRNSDARRQITIAAVVVGGAVDTFIWFGSGSLTPAFAVLVALATGGLIVLATRPGEHRARRATLARVLATAAAGVAIVVVLARTWLTDRLGRSPTLSGRTEIWAEMIDAWQRRPIAGFGFMAVWFDPITRAGLIGRGRNVNEAHSGYFEVLVGTGIIGAVILAAVIVLGIIAVAQRVRERADTTGIWLAMAVAFALAANLGETYIGANLFIWMMFVLATVQARMSSASSMATVRP